VRATALAHIETAVYVEDVAGAVWTSPMNRKAVACFLLMRISLRAKSKQASAVTVQILPALRLDELNL
jgi:hypothetical protein